MGAFKKEIRSEIKRAARMVLVKFHKETSEGKLDEKTTKQLVSMIEKSVTADIMQILKSGVTPHR